MTTKRRQFSRAGLLLMAVATASLNACSPALDWRESLAEGTGLVTSFPCRPDRHTRSVPVDGSVLQMEMLSCPAAGFVYAVSFFDVTNPARISSAMLALRAAISSNIQGTRPQLVSFEVPGMTPNPQSTRLAVTGQRSDGSPLQAQAIFFTRGLRVYQATVIGPALSVDAVDPFFSGLKFRR